MSVMKNKGTNNQMKAILLSVSKPHTTNINSGAKTSELRTRAPKIDTPFLVYMYETKQDGGCGKVVSKWICNDTFEWLMYMGVPAHLPKVACVDIEHIKRYSDNGRKNITEIKIKDVIVYDDPIPLSRFGIDRPPQNWCYVIPLEEDMVA